MGQKDGNFLFRSKPDTMVTFLGLKNHTYPFFRHTVVVMAIGLGLTSQSV